MAETFPDIGVAAVIPAFNEAARVGNVVRAAIRCNLIDAVVVVDDGSEDATLQHAQQAAEIELGEHPKSFFNLFHARNVGKTETLREGVKKAKEIGGSTLKTLVFL